MKILLFLKIFTLILGNLFHFFLGEIIPQHTNSILNLQAKVKNYSFSQLSSFNTIFYFPNVYFIVILVPRLNTL